MNGDDKTILDIYRNYTATKIFLLFVQGYDKFKEGNLLDLLQGLGHSGVLTVASKIPGFDPKMLIYEAGKEGERWVGVKREMADSFFE